MNWGNRNLKFFCLRILLFFVPVLLFCLLLENYNKNRIANEINTKLALIENFGDSVNTVIIGNSHARNGFISSKFPGICINAAVGGSSIFYTKEILQRILKKNNSKTIKTLYLAISYHTLFKDIKNESFLDRRYEFYHYLGVPYALPKGFDLRKFSIISTISFKAAIDNYLQDNKKNKYEAYNNFGYTPSSKVISEKNAEKLAKKRMHIHHEMMTVNNIIINENIELVEDIIKLAKRENIKIYLITTPVTPQYLSLEKENFKIYSTILSKIANKYKINYYNFSGIYKDLSYFKDPDHLNKFGAENFSQKIIDLIK